MVGSGRHFEEEGFLAKLSEIEGYVLSDIESFPEIRFWIIASTEVMGRWKDGELGTIAGISRKKALSLLSKQK